MNGIRNPFSYEPWCRDKSFRVMLDTLGADIFCLQETKIQSKDLTDDMVLVPGWDSYFSFPKSKNGYSGVAVYTRLAVCQPLRAEEGITGILDSRIRPGTPCKRLPAADVIGGYPDLSDAEASLLDSEGRALVLDFGAFVLLAVYCPASGAEDRDDFRKAFVDALFCRVRNLIGQGRHVVLVGDLNIARDEIDAAEAYQLMLDAGLADWKSTPTRARLHRLLEPHPDAVMTDLCRDFFPNRRGMFTHWDVRKNKRPGNAGTRLDYVLCSSGMKDWFLEADIQQGLLGSDHCPVYAVLKPKVVFAGAERAILDILNPDGTFLDGKRQSGVAMPPAPLLSMKRFPEYSQRQSIRGMFERMAKSSRTPSNQSPPPPSPGAAAEAAGTQAAGQRLADAMSPLPRLRRPTPSPTPQQPAKRQRKRGDRDPNQTSLDSFLRPTVAAALADSAPRAAGPSAGTPADAALGAPSP